MNEEFDRINLVAEREFSVKRQMMNMICLERVDEFEIADDDADDFDYVFDESENDDNNVDDLNGSNDELNGRGEASDRADSNRFIWHLLAVFVLILLLFTFVFVCYLSFLITLEFISLICCIWLYLPDIFISLLTKMFAPFYLLPQILLILFW